MRHISPPPEENPKYVHLRKINVDSGEMDPKGGVTLCYSISEDRRWMRIGASFCSLSDTYSKDHKPMDELTPGDIEWLWDLGKVLTEIEQDPERNDDAAKHFKRAVLEAADHTITGNRLRGIAFRMLTDNVIRMRVLVLSSLPVPEHLVGRSAAKNRYEWEPIFVLIPSDWLYDGRDWNDIVGLLNDEPARAWLDRALQRGLWDTWELRTIGMRWRTWGREPIDRQQPQDRIFFATLGSSGYGKLPQGYPGTFMRGTNAAIEATPPKMICCCDEESHPSETQPYGVIGNRLIPTDVFVPVSYGKSGERTVGIQEFVAGKTRGGV